MILTDLEGDHIKLDVGDYKATRKLIMEAKPDIILHLAAATDVDRCEKDKSWAYTCNMEGTKNVAMVAKDCKAFMVYMSTGSVFSGKLNRPARETDIADPVNIYGASKFAGEKEVGSILKDFLIVRAGWVMGGGPAKDKKFVGKIMEKILSGERVLKVINDKFGSPIYAKDLLKGIKELLSLNKYGIYHMVNENAHRCSRYDITKAIKEILKKEGLNIEPVSSDAFSLLAPRALSEELDNFKLKQMGLDFMRPWEAALEEYLKEDWGLSA